MLTSRTIRCRLPAAGCQLPVTYNFDPDRWYENERLRLEQRRRSGELTEDEAAKAADELERRYEAMLARLDGTFPVGRQQGPER